MSHRIPSLMVIAILRTGNDYLRETSAWALGELGDARAIEPLIAAVTGPSVDLNSSAVASLNKLTHQHLGQYPTVWQQWWEANKGQFQPR
jgi:HEAT repeat protein